MDTEKLEIEIRNCNSRRSLSLLADQIGLQFGHSQVLLHRAYEARREEIERECARRGYFNPAGRNPWR